MNVVPKAKNEPVYTYAKGTKERAALQDALKELKSQQVEIPMIINGEEIKTGKLVTIHPPHELDVTLGSYHMGDATHVQQAIDASLQAKASWEAMCWRDRAAIFLRAASLIAGPYRYKMNAATMLGQSKNPFQSEIDAVAELVDFLRFNVEYMTQMMEEQPLSTETIWNKLENRPLEGFVLAISPFNFTAIGGNLPTAPAMLGNTVVWKPSRTQVYSAALTMEILREAGLPDGVINMVYTSGSDISKVALVHPDLAGVHFTGSTRVFQDIWKTIGGNIHQYKTYPRIVGETGGKNFVVMHPSANAVQVATAITRGGFEYQGQKCSAASRIYIPKSRWEEVKAEVLADLASIKVGPVDDFSNFVNAVIDEASFDSLMSYIERAKASSECEILAGGKGDKTKGYFIEPTLILTSNPRYETMVQELFGPVVTLCVYDDEDFEATLHLVNETSEYALTGSIFSKDRAAIRLASEVLKHAAGNFYINDKPTGAVVGQQPFGGARGSGTNDKAGSYLNLLRWVSPRTVKENFVPDESYKYPFLEE